MLFRRPQKQEKDELDATPEFDGQCGTCEHAESEGDTYWCHFFMRSISKAEAQEGCRGYIGAEPLPEDDLDDNYPDYNEDL